MSPSSGESRDGWVAGGERGGRTAPYGKRVSTGSPSELELVTWSPLQNNPGHIMVQCCPKDLLVVGGIDRPALAARKVGAWRFCG